MRLDELSQADQAFLRGCLIGDGWLGLQRNQYAHLRIGHSAKQLEWLKWKAKRINAIIGSNRSVLGPYYQGSGRKDGKKYESYLYVVDNHELFASWYQRWYCTRNGKTCKIIDKAFLKGLDLQA